MATSSVSYNFNCRNMSCLACVAPPWIFCGPLVYVVVVLQPVVSCMCELALIVKSRHFGLPLAQTIMAKLAIFLRGWLYKVYLKRQRQLSLVHTCATRYDTTACDMTGQRSKAQQFLVWCHTYHDTTMRLDTDSQTL